MCRVCRSLSVDATSLTLRRLESVTPSPAAAFEFGGRLAVTHDAGAAGFGAGPDGWDGPGFFGPLTQPLPMSLRPHRHWGQFYADERLAPMAAAGRAASERVDSCGGRSRRGTLSGRRLRRRRPAGQAARRSVGRQRDVDAGRGGAHRPGRARRPPRERPGHARAVRLPALRRHRRRLPASAPAATGLAQHASGCTSFLRCSRTWCCSAAGTRSGLVSAPGPRWLFNQR